VCVEERWRRFAKEEDRTASRNSRLPLSTYFSGLKLRWI